MERGGWESGREENSEEGNSGCLGLREGGKGSAEAGGAT